MGTSADTKHQIASNWIFPVLHACLTPQEQLDSRPLLSKIRTQLTSEQDLSASLQQLRQQLSPEVHNFLASLAKESHPRLFWNDVSRLGNRFIAQGKWQEAKQIFGLITEESTVPQELKAKAQLNLAAIEGQGDFFQSLDINAQKFFQNALHPRTIVPLMFGALGSQWVYTRLLGRMAGSTKGLWALRGFSARVSAASFASLAETSLIVGASRSIGHAMGEAQLPLRQEFASTFLTLGVFKSVGFGAKQLFHRIHRTAELAPWTLGTPLYRGTRQLFPHITTIGALMLAHNLETKIGLGHANTERSLFWTALESWASLSISARLGYRLLPQRLKQAQRQWGIQNQIYLGAKQPPPPGPNFPTPWAQAQFAFAGMRTLPKSAPTTAKPLLMAALDNGGSRPATTKAKLPHEVTGFPNKETKASFDGEHELLTQARAASNYGIWYQSIEKLRAIYFRNLLKAKMKFKALKEAESAAVDDIKDQKLYHQLIRDRPHDDSTYLLRMRDMEHPPAINLAALPGPKTSRVSLNPLHPEMLHPLYYRIQDLTFFQDVVSEQKVASLVTAIRRGKKIPPIKIAHRPEIGYFIYDGYHRMMAAIETGNTHLLGIRVRHFSPFNTGPLPLAKIRKISHAEFEKLIEANDGDINPYTQSIREAWNLED